MEDCYKYLKSQCNVWKCQKCCAGHTASINYQLTNYELSRTSWKSRLFKKVSNNYLPLFTINILRVVANSIVGP